MRAKNVSSWNFDYGAAPLKIRLFRFLLLTNTVAALQLCVLQVVADTITLTNGQTLEGVILKENDDRIIMRNAGGEYSVNREKIAHIERELRSDNLLRELQEALQFADLDHAKKAGRQCLETGITADQLNETWQAYSENLVQTLQSATMDNRALARSALREIAEDDYFTTATLFHVSRVFHSLDATTDAAQTLALVDDETLLTDPGVAEVASLYLPRLARTLQKQGQYVESVEVMERLRPLDQETASLHQVILGLVESSAARRRQDFETALQLIRNQLAPQAPTVAINRVNLTVQELSRWATEQREEEKARKLMNQYALSLSPEPTKQALELLLLNQLDRLIGEARYQEVFALVNSLPAPEARLESVTKREALARHRLRYMEINREDPLQLLELALNAQEAGLEEEALVLLVTLQENPYLKETALQQYFLIREQQDIRLLNSAIAAFDAGEMERCVEICNSMIKDEGRHSPQTEELERLSQLAKKEIILQQEARPYLAEALYQDAERSYHLTEYDNSFTLVNTILKQYPETPAAERAGRLLPELTKAFELELLEGKRKNVPPAPAIDLTQLGPKTVNPLPLGRKKSEEFNAEEANELAREKAVQAALNQELEQLLGALETLGGS